MIYWTCDTVGGSVDISLNSEFITVDQIKESISNKLSLDTSNFYLTHNGKILSNSQNILQNPNLPIRVIPRILGGKGGFGSMLRAIGAQIEKTTNRDACRDLSGRRLRDINEEQRLKRWFAKQKEREAENAERKKRKLEKLRQICEGPPLPKMEDKEYNEQRANMAESVYEAVEKGLEGTVPTSTSSALEESSNSDSNPSEKGKSDSTPVPCSSKNNSDVSKEETKPTAGTSDAGKSVKLKKTMWDEDLDSDVSSSDSEDEAPQKKAKIKC